MPPKKRVAEADASEDETVTRASKVAKTTTTPKKPTSKAKASPKEKAKKPAKKTTPKSSLSAEEFQKAALPLHVHFTHTPPSISKNDEEPSTSSSSAPNTSTDAGHVGSVSMLPTTFSTGSHGWKASKPVTIELTDPDTGKKTKVNVQISINAVVKGSKPDEAAAGDAKNVEEEDAVAAAIGGDEDEEDG